MTIVYNYFDPIFLSDLTFVCTAASVAFLITKHSKSRYPNIVGKFLAAIWKYVYESFHAFLIDMAM